MPHMLLRDLLPAATYGALLEAIPRDEFFPDKDPIKQNLKMQQLDVAPAWTRRALTYLESTIIGTLLAPAVIVRMRPYLEGMYRDEFGPTLGPLVAALPHAPTAGRLMLRRPGYKLEPHLDPKRVAITCLIYFARPGDNARYGTELFALDRLPILTESNTFYPKEHGYKCRLVKAVPFEPNTALVFLNRGGAHAAEIPLGCATGHQAVRLPVLHQSRSGGARSGGGTFGRGHAASGLCVVIASSPPTRSGFMNEFEQHFTQNTWRESFKWPTISIFTIDTSRAVEALMFMSLKSVYPTHGRLILVILCQIATRR